MFEAGIFWQTTEDLPGGVRAGEENGGICLLVWKFIWLAGGGREEKTLSHQYWAKDCKQNFDEVSCKYFLMKSN